MNTQMKAGKLVYFSLHSSALLSCKTQVLSLSKQIVNELGGSLTVTSIKDVGSTFKIKLKIN